MSTSRRLRLIASGGAAAVAAASLTVLTAGSAHAADTDYDLRWGVSKYLNEHLTAQTFSGGASEDALTGVVTFTDGVAVRNVAAGTTTVSYEGDARYAFNNPGTGAEIYSITFSDPTIVTDEVGAGEIVADVAWSVTGGATGSLVDQVVTTFPGSGSTWAGNDLTGTPAWSGVAPADAYGAGKPAGGASWAVPFVTAVPANLNPFFYASGSANDYKKPPAAFTAEVPPSVAVTGSSFSPSNVSLTLSGARFTAVTNPGDAGVYVGLAPSGGLPDVTSQEGMDAFAASDWVTPGQIVAGVFTKTLTTTPAKLDPTKSYSLYTWQAHSHSNTTQDTETPVTIDWSALALKPSTVTPSGPASTTYGKSVVVKAAVPASGTVTLTGLGATQKKTLAAAGAVSFTIPASLAAGSYTAKLVYSGGGDYLGSQATKKLVVAQAATRTTVKVAPKPKPKKAGKATVTVTGAATGGKVAVVVKRAGKVVKKATVKVNAQGRVVVTLPKAAKGGTFAVTATYAGDKNRKASTGKTSYKVAKPKKAKKR